jgi:hypothetical protein
MPHACRPRGAAEAPHEVLRVRFDWLARFKILLGWHLSVECVDIDNSIGNAYLDR